MSAKCFRTLSLMRDDVLCHVGFCKKRVELEMSICIDRVNTIRCYVCFVFCIFLSFFSSLIVFFLRVDERMENTKMIEDLKWKNAEMIEQSEHVFPEYPEKLVRKEKKKKVSEPVNKVDPGVGSPYFVDTKEISYLSKKVSATSPRKFQLPRRGQLLRLGNRPHSPLKGLTYSTKLTLLKGPTIPLALSLLQHFISDTDVKTLRKESELEMEKQTLGLF